MLKSHYFTIKLLISGISRGEDGLHTDEYLHHMLYTTKLPNRSLSKIFPQGLYGKTQQNTNANPDCSSVEACSIKPDIILHTAEGCLAKPSAPSTSNERTRSLQESLSHIQYL